MSPEGPIATDAQDPSSETPVAGDMAPEAARQAGIDRFDEPIVVIRAHAWIGLVACLVLAAGVVIWSAVANVADTIKADGVVLVNGSIVGVPSPVAGEVKSASVPRGAFVRAQQTVATVVDPRGRTSRLLAPVAGYVLDLSNAVGSSVGADEVVVTMAQAKGPLRARVFLTPQQAQQVRPGTEAEVSAAGTGSFQGRVESVGKVPLDRDEVAGSLGSNALASLVASGKGLISVVIAPSEHVPSTDTADIVSVTLLVGSKHPIDAVL